MTEQQIDEVMELVSDWGMASHCNGEAALDAHNPEATEDEIAYAAECEERERATWQAIRAKLREVARKPLSDEKILELQESHVGGVCAQYPLDSSDWINFARAIEINHQIGAK